MEKILIPYELSDQEAKFKGLSPHKSSICVQLISFYSHREHLKILGDNGFNKISLSHEKIMHLCFQIYIYNQDSLFITSKFNSQVYSLEEFHYSNVYPYKFQVH